MLKVNAKTPGTPSNAAKDAVGFSPLSELGDYFFTVVSSNFGFSST
jgi:hypothetical protein